MSLERTEFITSRSDTFSFYNLIKSEPDREIHFNFHVMRFTGNGLVPLGFGMLDIMLPALRYSDNKTMPYVSHQ